MKYLRFAPHSELTDVVEHYWLIAAPQPVNRLDSVLVPTGRATVQFCIAEPGHRHQLGAGASEVNADVLLPVTTEPYLLSQTGPSHYVGVQFTPWGVATLWPAAPTVPTPICDIDAAAPASIGFLGVENPTTVLDDWLRPVRAGCRFGGPPRTVVEQAIILIEADPSHVTVAELASKTGVSTSTLRRAFLRWNGLSPRSYISLRRYFAFTTLLQHSTGDSVAFLAAVAGYADESHAAREFRRHTGMTSRRFRDRHDGIAAMMLEPPI